MIPMNTWKRPQLNMQEKTQLKWRTEKRNIRRNTTKIHKQKAITWTSLNNKIHRQIDYTLINQRFRNNVKSAQTIDGWQANMQQDKQHKAICMQICLKLAKTTENTKTGNRHKITYNIHDLKLYTETLKKCLELQTPHYEYDNNKTTQQNWQQIEQLIHTALQKTYPHKNKTQLQKDNDGINKQKNGVHRMNSKQRNT